MDFYLVWFDDDRKKAASIKIEEAIEAYKRRTGRHPNVVLINERDRGELPAGIRLRTPPYVQPSNFYVGVEEVA